MPVACKKGEIGMGYDRNVYIKGKKAKECVRKVGDPII